jgi:hypothetical protein
MGTKLYKYTIELRQHARSKRQLYSCVAARNDTKPVADDTKQVAAKRVNQSSAARQFVLVKANVEA